MFIEISTGNIPQKRHILHNAVKEGQEAVGLAKNK